MSLFLQRIQSPLKYYFIFFGFFKYSFFMLKLKKYLYITVAVFAFTACSKDLELEPANSVQEDALFSNPATLKSNMKAVLTGIYDRLGDSDVFGGSVLRNAELMPNEGEIQWRGTFSGPREMSRQALTAANDDVANYWLDSYRVINGANTVLANLNNVATEQRSQYEGEALFARALTFFELTRWFAKTYDAQNASLPAVPLVLAPTTYDKIISGASRVKRNTTEECYTQVINDLTKAQGLLPSSNGFFATGGAASALLARVYLQKGDYAKALEAADRVIQSGNFRLTDNYSDAFGRTTNSSEDIFAIQVTPQDGVNNMVVFFQHRTGGGRGDIRILSKHLNQYEAGDARAIFFQKERSGDSFWFCSKWTNPVAQNVNIIRLAEMYLIRAECNARLGSAKGASVLDDVNTIRRRAKLPALTTADLSVVLKERKLELAFEGHRIHDIKRLQQKAGSLDYSSPKLVFPIPYRDIVANPNLTQNEGY
jgi:starch-binding outer membrane protein, SusD/RagB family